MLEYKCILGDILKVKVIGLHRTNVFCQRCACLLLFIFLHQHHHNLHFIFPMMRGRLLFYVFFFFFFVCHCYWLFMLSKPKTPFSIIIIVECVTDMDRWILTSFQLHFSKISLLVSYRILRRYLFENFIKKK